MAPIRTCFRCRQDKPCGLMTKGDSLYPCCEECWDEPIMGNPHGGHGSPWKEGEEASGYQEIAMRELERDDPGV